VVPARKQALANASQGRGKGWKCEKCGVVGKKYEVTFKTGRKQKRMPVQVDHIVPVGVEPQTLAECGPWLERLINAPLSNLQVLCLLCHKAKTKAERVTEADLDEFAKRFKGADNVKADVNSERSKQVVRQVRRRVSVRKEARPDQNSGG
jgi:hypothetical protein